ncbi:MAG: sortase-associated OmpA-like protein PdsO [Pseudomonadota bacterium]
MLIRKSSHTGTHRIRPLVLGQSLLAGGILLLATTVSAAPAQETFRKSPEERRGALIGAIVGAGVAGPFGAGAGTIIGGAFIGKGIANARIKRELGETLDQERSEHAIELERFDRRIARLRSDLSQAEGTLASINQVALVPVQFKTASSDIEAPYLEQLAAIARLMKRQQDIRVTLSGHADRRGEDDYNQALSEMRVHEVRDVLVDSGIASNRIVVTAHGETQPLLTEQSFENDFFDRRVDLRLHIGQTLPLAAR